MIQSRTSLGRVPNACEYYLEERAQVRVRFQEADPLRIVWHGHYASYFEEGRRAFGRAYGIDYEDFLKQEIAVPVVQLHVDYFSPALWTDTLEVTARLCRTEAARLDFRYEVRRAGPGTLLAGGYTVQVFTKPNGDLLLTWPPYMQERLRAWEDRWIHNSPNLTV
jgi:acyl-CoA thioester hydrolase